MTRNDEYEAADCGRYDRKEPGFSERVWYDIELVCWAEAKLVDVLCKRWDALSNEFVYIRLVDQCITQYNKLAFRRKHGEQGLQAIAFMFLGDFHKPNFVVQKMNSKDYPIEKGTK